MSCLGAKGLFTVKLAVMLSLVVNPAGPVPDVKFGAGVTVRDRRLHLRALLSPAAATASVATYLKLFINWMFASPSRVAIILSLILNPLVEGELLSARLTAGVSELPFGSIECTGVASGRS